MFSEIADNLLHVPLAIVVLLNYTVNLHVVDCSWGAVEYVATCVCDELAVN